MGAWGNGIYDNDTAMDLKDEFEEMIAKNESVEDALKYIKEDWFMCSDSLLVFIDLHMKYGIKIDEKLYKKVLEVIKDEINNSENWREPKERKLSLLKFEYKFMKYMTE